jgi:hypothetical protein
LSNVLTVEHARPLSENCTKVETSPLQLRLTDIETGGSLVYARAADLAWHVISLGIATFCVVCDFTPAGGARGIAADRDAF